MIVRQAMTSIPGIIACGLIDLDTKAWIEIETQGSHPEDFVQYLAISAAELFEGDAVTTISTVLETAAPPERQPMPFEEAILLSGRLWHFFRRLPAYPRILLAIITHRSTRMGLVRTAIADLTELPMTEAQGDSQKAADLLFSSDSGSGGNS